MKKFILATAILASLSASATADSYGKPCTSEPESKWMSLEAIEKNIKERGYDVVKSKMKAGCAEIYARDTDGKRIEFFVDPATGNPVGTQLKAAKG